MLKAGDQLRGYWDGLGRTDFRDAQGRFVSSAEVTRRLEPMAQALLEAKARLKDSKSLREEGCPFPTTGTVQDDTARHSLGDGGRHHSIPRARQEGAPLPAASPSSGPVDRGEGAIIRTGAEDRERGHPGLWSSEVSETTALPVGVSDATMTEQGCPRRGKSGRTRGPAERRR